MNTLGFDFRDTWLSLNGLSFALRLATSQNLYAPDPASVIITAKANEVSMEAARLSFAGGQQTAKGGMALRISCDERGIFCIRGHAVHETETGRSLVLLVRGLRIKQLTGESDNMPSSSVTPYQHAGNLSWPGREATMPLVMIGCEDQPEAFALSRDTQVRKKTFSAYYDFIFRETVLVLSHQEDARKSLKCLELPVWEVGLGIPRSVVVSRRFEDLEKRFFMKPFAMHPERQWVNDLKLVVNLHGIHWTGYVYLTYAQQAEALRKVCEIIPGKHVLAFLPAWEGRYYNRSPVMSAAPELGGSEGLHTLVETAHRLGAHIIPMLCGPNLADESFLKEHGLMDARLKSEYGDAKVQNWVDWNSDLSYEKMGWLVNFGHPGFRDLHAEMCCRLLGEYAFDGVFLDGAIRWENSPDYSPYEGMKAWSEAIRKRFPNALLMGEDGYDLLWDIFGLFASFMQPLGLDQAMLRYTRQSWYLAYPAPGGSGGIHEQAWYSPTDNGKLGQYIIPTFSIVGDTLKKHGEEMKAALQKAAAWDMGKQR